VGPTNGVEMKRSYCDGEERWRVRREEGRRRRRLLKEANGSR